MSKLQRLLVPTPKRAITQWILGFLQAGAILAVAPRKLAEETTWEPSPWQREIAIWNAGMIATAVAVRRTDDVDEALGRGFTLLSALFAANHLVALRRAPTAGGHWLAAIANIAGIGNWLVAKRFAR